jgi:hypothetical protein
VKLKALVITALFVAGIATSVAVAKGPPKGKGKSKDDAALSSSTGSTSTSAKGKGKDKKKDAARVANTCKPTVSYILSGDFVAAGGSSSSASTPSPTSGPAILGTFQLKVRQANKHAKDMLGDVVTVSYDKKTKFRRRGHADIDDFVAGDRVKAHVRACKAPKQRRQDGTTTGTTASTSTATTTTGTTPGSSDRLLLAKKVDGKPAKAGTTTTGTTSTGTTTTAP